MKGFSIDAVKEKRICGLWNWGGGTGLHAEHFLENESECIAEFIFCDLSKDMLMVAKKRLEKYKKKIVYINDSAENFKIHQKVDCIYISGAMHHFENPQKAIRNCYRHLAADGILIICEPVITNPYAWPRVLLKPEEYGQFRVTPHHILQWLKEGNYTVLDKKWMHYKSRCFIFHFLLKLEKLSFMNWSAVMFAVVARRSVSECSRSCSNERKETKR